RSRIKAGRFDRAGSKRSEPSTEASNDSPRKSLGRTVPAWATSMVTLTLTLTLTVGLVSEQPTTLAVKTTNKASVTASRPVLTPRRSRCRRISARTLVLFALYPQVEDKF